MGTGTKPRTHQPCKSRILGRDRNTSKGDLKVLPQVQCPRWVSLLLDHQPAIQTGKLAADGAQFKVEKLFLACSLHFVRCSVTAVG